MNRAWMYGHVKTTKNRTAFLEFRRYLRSLYPPEVPIAIVCDNYSAHLSTSKDDRVGMWATAHNVEFAYVSTDTSYLSRIECHFQALRYFAHFALNGTDHRSCDEQNSMIRRYIAWRSVNASFTSTDWASGPCLARMQRMFSNAIRITSTKSVSRHPEGPRCRGTAFQWSRPAPHWSFAAPRS
jgi:hypothetical protein